MDISRPPNGERLLEAARKAYGPGGRARQQCRADLLHPGPGLSRQRKWLRSWAVNVHAPFILRASSSSRTWCRAAGEHREHLLGLEPSGPVAGRTRSRSAIAEAPAMARRGGAGALHPGAGPRGSIPTGSPSPRCRRPRWCPRRARCITSSCAAWTTRGAAAHPDGARRLCCRPRSRASRSPGG